MSKQKQRDPHWICSASPFGRWSRWMDLGRDRAVFLRGCVTHSAHCFSACIHQIISCTWWLGEFHCIWFAPGKWNLYSFGKSELVEHTHINFWSKKWNPRRANLHMLGRHREYVCTFNEKFPLMVGMVYYDRPFMDHIEWKNDNIFTEKINER